MLGLGSDDAGCADVCDRGDAGGRHAGLGVCEADCEEEARVRSRVRSEGKRLGVVGAGAEVGMRGVWAKAVKVRQKFLGV